MRLLLLRRQRRLRRLRPLDHLVFACHHQGPKGTGESSRAPLEGPKMGWTFQESRDFWTEDFILNVFHGMKVDRTIFFGRCFLKVLALLDSLKCDSWCGDDMQNLRSAELGTVACDLQDSDKKRCGTGPCLMQNWLCLCSWGYL